MCEYFWEPLAEVHLSLAGRTSEEDIYCLCSRVIIRDGDDLAKGMCEKADGSEDDSTQYDEYDKTSVPPFCMNNVVSEHQTIRAVGKHDTEEAVSCYCSAAHTDNNYSTDEHEHDSGVGIVRSGLQLSDSGADLSECGDFQCSSSSRNEDWERYWSINGERIIWQSWIAKYGEYINPGYLEQQGDVLPFVQNKVTYDSLENKTNQDNVINDHQNSSQSQDSFENTHFNTFQPSVQESMSKDELNTSKNITSLNVNETGVTTTSGNFLLDENAADTTYSDSECKKTEWQGSFDVMLPAIVKTDTKNKDEDLLTSPCDRTETKHDVLTCNSDESNTSPTDRWSPLSPSSTDDSSGDGGVVAGSVANTAITSDSMTNVTKITVSSLDLSYGDMEDSVPSSSFSSSSASSGSATGTTDEADHYWQNLWKQHFNEQYYAHYSAFLSWEIKEVNVETDVIRHPLFQLGEEPESAKQDSFNEIEPSLGIASASCNKSNTELNIVEDYYSSNDVLSHDVESSKCKSCSSKVDDLKDSLKNLSCSCSLTLTEENFDNTKTLSIEEDFSSVGKMELSPGTEHSFEELNHAKEELISKMEKMCGEIRQHNISVDEDISGIGRMELSPGTDHSLEELDHERQHLNSVSSTDMLVEDREDTFADVEQDVKYNGNSNASKKESHVPRAPKKISSRKRKSRLLLNSVGHLLKTLSMLDCQFDPDDSPNDAGGDKKKTGTPEKEEICKKGSSSNEQTHDTNPLENSTHNGNDDGDEPPEERPITLKRSHESDSDESSLDRVKSAFTLLGLAFAPNKQYNSSLSSIPTIHRGSVFYRKRNIRDQNRQLKMNIHQRRTQKQQQIPVSNSASSVLDKAKQFFESEAQFTAEDTAIRAALCSDGHSSSDDEQLAPPSRNITYTKREKRRLPLSTVVCPSVEGDMDLAESDYEDMDQHEEQYATPMENEVETEQENKIPTDEVSESTVKELESITSAEVVPKEENGGEEVVVKKTQQKKKKKKQNKKASLTSLPEEIVANKTLRKYWIRRYQLFSKFDEGIKLDEESWFSSTPERVASHIAERCRCDLIIDAFCGAGSCAIQFALTCSRVIAIDIDPKKIEIARHNANIYGVADRIEFLVGDFMCLAPSLRADVVFLSPPWGGPQYKNVDAYDIESLMKPIGGRHLFETSLLVTDNVAYYVPRNINTDQLVMLAGQGGEVEIEQSFLDKRLVAVTAYYGELIHEEA